uniref:histidine kinase n=1 Tax=Roseihalotalea indica TaxID=2867963 RepID=A0AA49GQM4_9BACT|nr:ATP-binding protein [Tunicatimonas sp. TK19036]
MMEEKQTVLELIQFRHMLTEADHCTILLLNKAGIIEGWNESAEKMMGYEASEVIDQSFDLFLEDKEQLLLLLKQAREQNRAESSGWITRKNDDRFWGKIVITTIPDSPDKISGFTGFIQDLSSAQTQTVISANSAEEISGQTEDLEKINLKLQREITNYKREVQAITYAVSHDLQAPLRAITGYSDILQEDYKEKLDDEGVHILGVITRNVSRTNQLIKEILDFSRLNRRNIAPQILDMNQVFVGAYDKLKASEPTSRIIEFQLNELPAGYGDPVMIDRVVTNLLSNALKFTRTQEAATITVTGHTDNNVSIYSVQDNGVGFDDRYKDKLFEIFQRLHKGDEFEGLGMGLAIVQQVIHNHGGTVGGTGQPGQGASFFFTLPLIDK